MIRKERVRNYNVYFNLFLVLGKLSLFVLLLVFLDLLNNLGFILCGNWSLYFLVLKYVVEMDLFFLRDV